MNDTLFDYGTASPATSGAGVSLSWIVVVVVAALILIAIITLFIVIRRMLNKPELHGLSREEILRHWTEIEKISTTGGMGAKMAIVEADKLLDGALKSMSMAGDTLGERLKFASYKYPELRKVWFAHKLRNQIVHEMTFEVSPSQARSAIHEYKKALKTIQVL